jgi:hypothetical protein
MDGQTIFAILVGAALACFSLVMVGYSFFRSRAPEGEPDSPVQPSEDQNVDMDAIFDSIDTLELEYQLGNIPEMQYRQQLQSYRLQVAVAVRDQLERGDGPAELVLEQEVLRARSSVNDRFKACGSSWRSCPQCDAPLPFFDGGDSGGATCPHCNAVLPVAAIGDDETEMPPEGSRGRQAQQ